MNFIQENIFFNLVLLLTTALLAFVSYIRHAYTYWKRKNVPFLQPKFPLGNNNTILPKGIAVGTISKKFYDEFRKMGTKFGGVYFGIQPQLVVTDLEYIKNILNKDFGYFVDRGIYQNESDPISVNIFSQPGDEWRLLRVKFSTIFTSAKMKSMFHTMLTCTTGMEDALVKFAEEQADVDIIDVTACFTTDVIGSCILGVECNSFKHPDAEFRRMTRKVFEEFNLSDQINLFFTLYFPNVAARLGVRNIQKESSAFFFKSVKDTVEYRERNNIRRADLLQLLIDMKNSETGLTMNQLTAQVFLFFLAGFDTSSLTIAMALYELGRNQEAQNKVREEIFEVLSRYDNEITYDSIAELKYLAQVVDETLRLWPPVATVTRVCTKNYKFHDSDLTVEQGTKILISVLGLHYDAEYWPDPLTWDPERFSEANKKNRSSFVHLPFGDGPRNCIGLRFGLTQTKVGLVQILKKFRVLVSPKTVTPLGMDPDTFVLHTINKVYLNFEKL